MECGVACLAMLCGYFGKIYSLAFLGNYCQPTKSGISLLGISQAAANLGLQSESMLLANNELRSLSSPCILHWNQNHFVVLSEIKKHRYHILDPGKGRMVLDETEFNRHWICDNNDCLGIALQLSPTDRFGTIVENTPAGKSIGFLWNYIKGYRTVFTQIILSLFLTSGLQLILPFLTRAIVDIGISQSSISIILLILLGEFMIIFGKTASEFIRSWLLLHISMRINISLLSDFLIKLLKLPMSYFDTRLMGDLLQRMNDHTRVQSFLTSQTLNILFSSISLLVFGAVLLVYSSSVFFIFLAGSILYGMWTILFLHRRRLLDYEIFEIQSINQNKTIQLLAYMQEIKLHNCENRRRWEWEDAQTEVCRIQTKALKLQQTQQAGAMFINELKNIGITALAAYSVIEGNMTLGTMLAIQYIIGQLNSPIEKIMAFVYSFQDVRISLERINEIHNVADEDSGAGLTTLPRRENDIVFKNVNFRYDMHSTENTISDISFTIPSGKVTAIVGPSGSGKTTLLKLMLGFYHVSSGMISVGGKNIDEYNMMDLRRSCGTVMQDGVIFSDSIARNIAVDNDEIDYERLFAAAELACLHSFIMKLPHKYETRIGHEGMGISKGQKQRILIARAVYRNPDFIFLDEATNALDAGNERRIIENLDRFYRGRTVVVVAHRLSTVRNADQIIVVENGRLVEAGKHATLIKKKGAYYNLVKNQLELGN